MIPESISPMIETNLPVAIGAPTIDSIWPFYRNQPPGTNQATISNSSEIMVVAALFISTRTENVNGLLGSQSSITG